MRCDGGTLDAVDLNRLIELFQVCVAESFHTIASAQASDGLRPDQELAGR